MIKKEEYKIALVLPRGPMRSSAISQAGSEHLGLGYIASTLRAKGYNVKILNFQIQDFLLFEEGIDEEYDISPKAMAKEIFEFKPNLVGISTTGITLDNSLLISKHLKEINSEIRVLLGGHQASVTDQDILAKENYVDFVIKGEGEKSFLELADQLRIGEVQFENIEGLTYRQDGEVRCNPMGNHLELDELPMPARDDLEIIKERINIKQARISTSRGCLHACTFCIDPSLYRKRIWYAHSAKRVVDEMELLNKKYDIEHFWINDDNFIVATKESKQRAWDIGNEIMKRDLKIHYRVFFRSDVFKNGTDDGLLKHLYDSGLRIALVGFESGSPIRLKRFKKNTTVDLNLKVAKLIKENNLGLQIGFIMFDPLSTFEDLRKDIEFLYNIDEMYLVYNFIQNLDVFHGSEIANYLEAEGLLNERIDYKSPYRVYRFKDDRVGKLAKAMENIFDSETIRRDKILQKINIFEFPNLSEYVMSSNDTDLINKVNKFDDVRKETVKKLNDINYEFMIKAIDLAENEFDLTVFENMKNKVIEEQNYLYSNLLNQYTDLEMNTKTGDEDNGKKF
ncbi:B12-binding domain-containing radical SAM protein [Alkaliphilus hydrothermalis]|uniref:Radical SAM superfamily enzyme YgiQ (UPF0313 family) n=1 Tax=Alkaliphilus hydrothermalis TaxID=1482730 RepID=A0ABS2NTC3_9FIRM|nr:radical SAM protein [Alkaliphilus hydrothermalis]MBM7616203.1 radical SAM superfamily enzyme YgiQ (UPF0313 family) [Alkaliphilus hydrothermalis]